MVDHAQLDDGCIDWGSRGSYGAPWTERRRNLIGTPRPAAFVGSGWATGGGTIDGEWVVNNTAAATTAYIFTDGSTEPQLIGDVYSAQVTYMVTALGVGTTATHISTRFHNRTGNWYFDNTRVALPIRLNVEETVTIQWTATRAAPVNDLDVSLVTTNATGTASAVAGAGFSMRARRPIVERGPTVGAFFDGDSPPTAPEYRHAWTGAAQNSASVEELGTWIPDTSGTVGPGVTADDGLKVTWGRANSVDQPDSSSCTFRAFDDPGGVTYVSALRIGSVVEVFADAEVTADPTVNTFQGGDFESTVNGTPGPNATLTRSTVRAHGGTGSARIESKDQSKLATANLAPDVLQVPPANPAAWDQIPTISGGQTWRIELDVWAGPGVIVQIRPIVYAAPYPGTATALSPIATYTGDGQTWQPIAASFVPSASVGGGWLGVRVELSGGLAWDALDPGITWDTMATADLAWNDFAAAHVDNVRVLSPAAVTTSSILVFSGRVTDLHAAFDEDQGVPVIEVTASDFLAELANRYVGSAPWPAERLDARVNRILTEAQVSGEAPIVADVAPSVADVVMSWQDVDRQPAAGLLTDVAQSPDAILWSATHVVSGPYVRIEDPSERVSMYQLALVGGVIVIVPVDFSTADPERAPLELSACDMLRDPVEFTVDVADVASRVTVEWLQEGVDDKGKTITTDRRELVINPQREAAYGSRSISLSTLLTNTGDANTVADQVIARLDGDWRVTGITVADADFTVPDSTAAVAQLRLLNGVLRGGLPVQITDMPDWNPIADPLPGYVEGGEYTYSGGGWSLALVVSRATGFGHSAAWDELTATWTWNQWDPVLTWNDLRGVAAPTT